MRWPSIEAVAEELRRENAVDSGRCDVRLQVYPDGRWAVRYGAPDYDLDHHGFWGASSIPGKGRRFNSRDVARDLLEQAKDQAAQAE